MIGASVCLLSALFSGLPLLNKDLATKNVPSLNPTSEASDVSIRFADGSKEVVSLKPLPSALQDKKEKKRNWDASVALGASQSYGNTELSTISLAAEGKYRFSETDRLSGIFDWYYSQEKNQTTGVTTLNQRRVRAAAQYDHFFSKKAYGYARVDASGDAKQNLSLRLISGVGAGLQINQTEKREWSIEAGLAHTSEDFKGKPANDYISARVATKYMVKLGSDYTYRLELEWLPSLEDMNDQLLYGKNLLEMNLGKGVKGSFRYEFDYDNTPGNGKDRLDHRFILGLGVSF
jgi:putative salt-induced outer membrane protein YdiY